MMHAGECGFSNANIRQREYRIDNGGVYQHRGTNKSLSFDGVAVFFAVGLKN